MYIPKYFTLLEFINSTTAKKYGIDNTPTFTVVNNLANLCELVLDDARHKLGSPIVVTSGYRSVALNLKIGGMNKSQHLTGCAVDIQSRDNDRLFQILCENPNIDQLLYENNGRTRWLHVSITQTGLNPRRYINGNYIVREK